MDKNHNFCFAKQSEPIEKSDSAHATEQDDSSNIDLDTRIAMMFKEKSFGAAPPFLQLDDSESETEKESNAAEHASADGMTTEPNADIASETKEMTAIKAEPNTDQSRIKTEKSKFDDASDISSDDEMLLKESGSPKAKTANKLTDDDRMSLSSLSSNDEKKQSAANVSNSANSTVPAVPNPGEYYYGAAGTGHPYSYYPNGANPSYDPYNNQYMPHSYIQPYVSGFSALIPGGYNVPADELAQRAQETAGTTTAAEQKKDPNEIKVTAVIDRVIKELRQILKKDINKRMVESIAYKQFEAWWDEQARRDKNKSNVAEETVAETKLVKVPDINQVINHSNSRDNNYDYNGLGLGFRTQILKLPRFQRIRKAPSPVRQDEDSKKGLSDQEDIVQDSDSDGVIDAPKSTSTFNEKLKENESKLERKRKGGSVSSFFTSSSEENSSSGESDSELDTSSLSDVDDFETELVGAPKTKNLAKKIYSDSDSEDEVKAPVVKSLPVAKSKLRLYSDTVTEEDGDDGEDEDEEDDDDDDDEKEEVDVDKVKTPEPTIDLDEVTKPPRTPGRESSPSDDKKHKSYDYDRLYSDSEEEREYQEKRRRNTEYMEQIEREFMEEQMAQQQSRVPGETTDDDAVPEKAPSPGDPGLSSAQLSTVPTTPDVKLEPPLDEPLRKKAPTKKSKAGTKKSMNGLPTISETSEDDVNRGKASPASYTSQESQTSQLSQVQLEHCYSLPPSASPASVSTPTAHRKFHQSCSFHSILFCSFQLTFKFHSTHDSNRAKNRHNHGTRSWLHIAGGD